VPRPERTDLDAATLREELDARWPGAVGAARASTDETHRLALVHPQYDGFVTLAVTARTDLDGVFVVADPELVDSITSHHRTGPIARGQVLPIDLELHPGAVRDPATSGELRLVDASGDDVAPPVRVTLATDATLDCVLAGADDGPFDDPAAFELAIAELRSGVGSARSLARRVRALEAGRVDPGWGRRLPWRSR
jgi:hypothetical protein